MFGSFTDFTINVTGTVWKETHCSSCRSTYFYQMTRSTTGSSDTLDGRSKDVAKLEAEQRAQLRLRELLETDFELIPCPTCGSYQPNMCETLCEAKCASARQRREVFTALTCSSLLATVICFGEQVRLASVRVDLAMAALTVVFGIGIPISHRRYLAQRRSYNPNNKPLAKRLKIARRHALNVKQLRERLTAEANSTGPVQEEKPWNRRQVRGAGDPSSNAP